MAPSRLAAVLAVSLWACGGSSDQPPDPLRITTSSLPTVAFREDYAAQLAATGGLLPYVFRVEQGTLPDGISLSPAGRLSGVAGSPGLFSLTFAVTDAAQARATAELTLRVLPDPLEVVTRSLPSARENVAYDHPLTAKGGVRPYTWRISAGTSAPGLTLDAEGHLTGVPTTPGEFDFTLTLSDSANASVEQALHLVVNAANPMILNDSLPKATAGSPYEATLIAEGGNAPYVWSITSGVLPAGLVLAPEGIIFGTPTETGDFTPTVRVLDARARSEVKELPLRVIEPLRIVTPALATVIRNRPYQQTLQAEGGEPPYAWTLDAGAQLPAGINFDLSGRFSGTTVEVGEYPLLVRVHDQDGAMRSTQYTLRVSDRYAFEIIPTGPAAEFPPVCTATTVSYHYVDLPVTDSFQIEDLDVTLDLVPPSGSSNVGVTLFSPDWSTQAVLCGSDGFGGCDPARLQQTYDDDGAVAVRPDRPLSAFDGQNPLGTWHLLIVVIQPNCTTRGQVRSVTLSFADDRSTDPYLHLSGWSRNNLVSEPFVHMHDPTVPGSGGVGPHALQLEAAIYQVGPNGYREGGGGDDVRDPTPLVWSWQGPMITGTTLTPDGQVTVDSSGACPSNCNGTGQALITVSGGGYAASTTLRVLPPDFNPRVRRY